MTAAIILVLPYPISANRYWASRVYKVKGTHTYRAMTYVTKEAEAYRLQVVTVAMLAGLPEPLTCRVELAYRLYPHRPQDWEKRQRKLGPEWDDDVMCMDLGNAEKVMSDALQGVAYLNDKQVRKIVAERMEPDEHGARLVVYVRRLPSKVTQQPLSL
jgi:crossover junction endodeoxyribonuclease RusA